MLHKLKFPNFSIIKLDFLHDVLLNFIITELGLNIMIINSNSDPLKLTNSYRFPKGNEHQFKITNIGACNHQQP